MRTSALFSCALFVMACAGTSRPTIEVKTADANVSRLVHHKTFAYPAAPTTLVGHNATPATPEVLTTIKSRVDADLRAKGYVAAESATAADVLVVVAAGTRQIVDQPSAGGARNGASATTTTERAIVVEILERESKAQLFHGYAHYGADPAAVGATEVQEAVTKILADVPRSAQ